jgi:tetratricopeptide (TPR) repeat protein
MADVFSPKKLADEARKSYQHGDYLAAARSFDAAGQGYLAAGDQLSAAEQANNSSVAYLQAGDAQAALQAVEGTAAVFAAANDLRRQGLALGNWAAAQQALGNLDAAIEAYQQSANLLAMAGEDRMRAHALKALSELYLKSGRQGEAVAAMQSALDGVKKPTIKERVLKSLLGSSGSIPDDTP